MPARNEDRAEHTDLIILAPTVAECRAVGWLDAAIHALSRRLARDGVVYVLASPRWRLRIASLLQQHGIVIEQAVAHLPDWQSTRYLLPLHASVVRYALTDVVMTRPWRRWMALTVLRVPAGATLLARVLPSVGLVGRPRYSRPLVAWLCDGNTDPGHALIRLSRRGGGTAAVLHRLSSDGYPSSVVKTVLSPTLAPGLAREAKRLAALGPAAERAGARIPRAVTCRAMGARPLLHETVVRGQPVAWRLLSEPESFSRLLDLLVGWLRKWNEATAVIGPLAWGRLDAEILAPAASLAPCLAQGQPYYEWLVTRCIAAVGARAPLVATHNDLTMSNVLVDEEGRLGIVDWEAGRAQGLPLVDYFYAVTDAALATRRTRDRVEMVEACFTREGEYASIVSPMLERLIRTLTIPAPVAELCFHACWLWHASNEQEQRLPGDPRPFLRIVQWLALRVAPIVGESAG